MKRFSFLIISVFPFFLSAQVRSDSLRREVTIEKDFTPIVRDASKINTLPEVEAPTVTKQSIRYSDWTVPAPLEPRAVLLAPGGFGEKPEENQSRGYVDFGIGNYLNMVGNAGYRILQNDKDKLGVFATSLYLRNGGLQSIVNGGLSRLEEDASARRASGRRLSSLLREAGFSRRTGLSLG